MGNADLEAVGRAIAPLFIAAEEAGHFVMAFACGLQVDSVTLSLDQSSKVLVQVPTYLEGTAAAIAMAGQMGVRIIFKNLSGLESQPDEAIIGASVVDRAMIIAYVQEALDDWHEEFLDVTAYFLKALLNLEKDGVMIISGEEVITSTSLKK